MVGIPHSALAEQELRLPTPRLPRVASRFVLSSRKPDLQSNLPMDSPGQIRLIAGQRPFYRLPAFDQVEGLKSIGALIGAMASDAAPTTITVPTYVRRALQRYKKEGQSYSDVILEFIEEWPTEDFLKEMERRERDEPRLTLSELRKLPGY